MRSHDRDEHNYAVQWPACGEPLRGANGRHMLKPGGIKCMYCAECAEVTVTAYTVNA